MSDAPPDPPHYPHLPHLPHIGRRRIPLVWAVPVFALLVAGWLAYVTLSREGPTVTIVFESGAGLEPGKTRIMHRDVQLGLVRTVALTPDLRHVEVTARMQREAEHFLKEGTRFWVVRPQFSLQGISGLETLVSGAHIEMDPGLGKGKSTSNFIGLEEGPIIRSGVEGHAFVLHSTKLGSVSPGSPIFFRGVKIGEVASYDLGDIDHPVTINIFIRSPYDRMVYRDSHFYRASAISFGSTPKGFKLEFESLEALLSGGVVLDTPEAAITGEPSTTGTEFTLFDDADSVKDSRYALRIAFRTYFDESVSGLEAGSAVEFRGLRIGTVNDVHIDLDPQTQKVRVPVTYDLEPGRLVIVGGAHRQEREREGLDNGQIIDVMVLQGLRAQLKTASLISGQMVVDLDFHPDAAPAELKRGGQYPEIPAIPSSFAGIVQSADRLVGTLAKLPFDKLAEDIHQLLTSANAVVSSPEIPQTLHSADSMMKDLDTNVGPLSTSLRRLSGAGEVALKDADKTLDNVNDILGGNSRLRRDLSDLVGELHDALRSIKMLAQFLEEHPEGLVRGKASEHAQ